MDGEVVRPNDAGYLRHRSVFDGMVDRRPAAIVRCRSRDDVVAALAFAAEHELPVAVRGGATSRFATADGGVVVDLSPIKSVQIDPDARIARVGAGLTWGEMDPATQNHGLAVPGARLSGLGVAGVTLEGGSGWLERAFGPTCESLVGAETVLADGRVVVAGDEDHSDLLWALRGGGGNLGIVTELELRLHRVGPMLLSGFLSFPGERAFEIGRFYRDYMDAAPDEVGGALVLHAGSAGNCTIAFCHVGSVADGERAIAPLRALGPSLDAVGVNEYADFQTMLDLQNPFGMGEYLRGGLLGELSDAALEAAVEPAGDPAASLSHVMFCRMGGAVDRVDRAGMALDLGGASWSYQCVGLWPPVESLGEGNIAWVKRIAAAIEPFAVGHAYPGSIAADEGPERLATAYGPDGYETLRRVKLRYDPDNVFRLNPNVPPSNGAGRRG